MSDAHQTIELLRFNTCGSVDDGKSTLIGRLLYDSKSIMEDEEFDAVLASHDLDVANLRESKIQEFLADRRHRFVDLVEETLGIPVIRDVDEANLAGGEEGPHAFGR